MFVCPEKGPSRTIYWNLSYNALGGPLQEEPGQEAPPPPAMDPKNGTFLWKL